MQKLPVELVQILKAMPWWQAVVDDPQLLIEVRFSAPASVTIYYRGAAMLRDLRIKDGKLICTTHLKYLPVGEANKDPDIEMVFDPQLGLVATRQPKTAEFGDGNPTLIRRFKAQMEAHNPTVKAEGKLIGAICENPRNLVIDREIALPGIVKTSDRPDLAVAKSRTSEVCIMEVKQVVDSRLRKVEPMIDQLQRYSEAIRSHRKRLIERFESVIQAKKELGLLTSPAWAHLRSNELSVDSKIYLAIGGCSDEQVKTIDRKERPWHWLRREEVLSICEVLPFGGKKTLFR
jgi:hypothetical protein